jgi:hypothetical protein
MFTHGVESLLLGDSVRLQASASSAAKALIVVCGGAPAFDSLDD